MEKTDFDGKRVRFLPGHPHAGETGVVLGAERTLAGWGIKVKLDNCVHGVESCFMFKPQDGAFIPDRQDGAT